MNILQVERLTKRYRKTLAVDGLSFAIRPGEILGLIGANGAGKTTTMAMLLGLVFGMGSCTIACLPYLGPVFIAAEGGVRQSWRIILPFSLGRLGSYASLATIAGLPATSMKFGPPPRFLSRCM